MYGEVWPFLLSNHVFIVSLREKFIFHDYIIRGFVLVFVSIVLTLNESKYGLREISTQRNKIHIFDDFSPYYE